MTPKHLKDQIRITEGSMSKLNKMKEDIDYGLPAVGKLIDEAANDLPKKVDSFFNSVADGFAKFFTH